MPIGQPQPVASDEKIKKLDWIDALRGLAVLGVINVHCLLSTHVDGGKAPWMPQWLYNLLHSGMYGVQLFFIVSAYTMFHSYYGRKGEAHAARNFFIRRYFRIAPMFYFGIVLYLGFNLVAWKEPRPIESILLTATFTHGFSPRWINEVVAGGWSIAVEFTFYLLVPWLAHKLTSFLRAAEFLTLTLAVGVVLYVLGVLGMQGRLGLPLQDFTQQYFGDDFFLYYWLPNQLPVFAFGFVLYFLMQKLLRQPEPKWSKAMLVAGLALMVIFGCLRPGGVLGHLPFAVAFFLFSIGMALVRPKIFVNAAIQKIGVDSFGIYIWHYAIKGGFDRVLPRLGLDHDSPYYLLVLIPLVIGTAYMMSELTRVTVEEPGQNLARKLIKKLQQGAKPQPA